MTAPAVLTLLVLVIALVMLVRSSRSQDAVLWGAVGLLTLVPVPVNGQWQVGVLTPADALHGLANEGVATIALLFVVAAGMRETGALRLLLGRVLGRPASMKTAQHRVVWPVALSSAFLNNTPLVAMLLPAVDEWARRWGLSVSKLLLPLSIASILGGAATLIGTSTNLIVNGWIIQNLELPSLNMFSITPVVAPIAIVGLLVTVMGSRWLLPAREPAISTSDDARRYTVEMIVDAGGDLVDKTVEEAGLRGLPGLFLIEIERDGETLPAVSGNVTLHGGDRLVFAGVVDSVVDLQKIRGLRPATNQIFKLNEPRHNRTLIEAVVSDSCPVAGKSIRDGRFRTRYNAAVIAVARNGERIDKKIGDIVLRPGDTLLLEARKNFAEQQRNSRDFYLVSRVDSATAPNYRRAPVAVATLAVMVALVATGLLNMLQAAMLGSGVMLLTGCCSPAAARGAVDWQVLLVLAAALALGRAMEQTGLATALGGVVIALFSQTPTILLAAVFALTAILAGLITSKTAAVLMLPIAAAAATELNINVMPLLLAVMIAAATTVATPIGYPTNLMVFGPGGYRFTDYLRLGVPITIVAGIITTWLVPLWWPF